MRLAALSPDTKVDAGCSFHGNMCTAPFADVERSYWLPCIVGVARDVGS